MGDPKKLRKKYITPKHPWIKERIDKEKNILKVYGLKNKKEIWKAETLLKRCREQAKSLISDTTEQGKKEEKQLLDRLVKLGLIKPGSKVEDVLELELTDVLERRLQTLIFKKDLTKSINQARQFIVHGHINIKDGKVNVPSYLVNVEEEGLINFNPKSDIANEAHPERFVKKENTKIIKKKKTEKVKDKKEQEKTSEKPKTVKKDITEKEIKTVKETKEKPKEGGIGTVGSDAKGPKEPVPKAEDLVKK